MVIVYLRLVGSHCQQSHVLFPWLQKKTELQGVSKTSAAQVTSRRQEML